MQVESTLLTVRIARTLEEVEALEDSWRPLASTPETDFDLVLESLRSAAGTVEPYVLLLVGPGERPLALAVARIDRGPYELRIGYRTILRSRVRRFLVPEGGIVGDLSPLHSERLADAMAILLRRGEVDLLEVQDLPFDSPMDRALRAATPPLCHEAWPQVRTHWRLVFPADRSTFSPKSSHSRRRDSYYARRLERRYGTSLRLRRFGSIADLDVLRRDVSEVASRTYQAGLGLDPSGRGSFEEQLRRGCLRASVLYIEDRPRAYALGVRYGNVFYTRECGYDPKLAADRVGTYLREDDLKEWCADPTVETVDFGSGDAEYKRRYGNESTQDVTLRCFAPSPLGLGLGAARFVVGGLDRALRGVVSRFGLFEAVRRRARARLVPVRPRASPLPPPEPPKKVMTRR